MPRTSRRALLLGTLALPGLAGAARATWAPARPVRLIVPFAEGGSNDEVVRALADAAEGALGQEIEILNEPGRAGVRAIAALAQAPADGLLLAQLPTSALRIALAEQLPFELPGDITPILSVAGGAFGTIAKPDRFPDGWAGFIREAREKPGALSYGSGGVNSTGHLTMERLLRREGVRVAHVPFRGAATGARALVAGDIDVMAGPGRIGAAVDAGEAVWLNVWSRERLARWPAAPTLMEQGYRMSVTSPFGIVGPPGLPAEIVAALHDAFRGAMRDPAFRAELAERDMTEEYRDGEAYAAFLAEAVRMEAMVVGQAGRRP